MGCVCSVIKLLLVTISSILLSKMLLCERSDWERQRHKAKRALAQKGFKNNNILTFLEMSCMIDLRAQICSNSLRRHALN